MRADQLDGPVHLHLHETAQEVAQSQEKHGQRPIARLDRLGLFNDRLIAVHMTQVTEAEIHLCVERGVSVVHCPESNLKLASGFCPACALEQIGRATSELQSLMRISYAVFCLKKKTRHRPQDNISPQ